MYNNGSKIFRGQTYDVGLNRFQTYGETIDLRAES
jgi:hypothetical protein